MYTQLLGNVTLEGKVLLKRSTKIWRAEWENLEGKGGSYGYGVVPYRRYGTIGGKGTVGTVPLPCLPSFDVF